MNSRQTFPIANRVGKAFIEVKNLLLGGGGGLLVLIALFVIFSFISPNFFRVSNLLNVMDQTAVLGILTIGEAFVIISGNIDISIGSILAISTMVMADMAKNYGLSPFLSIPVGMMVGIGFGFLNGLLVAKLKMNSLVSTLATYSVIKGIAWLYTNGQPIYPLPEPFRLLGAVRIKGVVQADIVYLLILIIIAQLFLGKTKFGRYVYGIGGNKQAAITSGINVDRIILYCYMISGAAAAFAGAILAGKLSTGSPEFGEPYLLTAVAAAVLGGASLFGGEGNIQRAYVGALVIIMIGNGLNLLLVPIAWQKVVVGIILAIAVFIDSKRHA